MITVECLRRSKTARKLAAALEGAAADGIINWTGGPLTFPNLDIPVLNSRSRTDKLAQLARLELCGVRVPPWDLNGKDESWYPRTLNHQQGRDFTGIIPAGAIAYYTQKLPLREEWRLHFFRTAKGNIKLLRSGIKVPRLRGHHPWVRSHRLGWKISYTGGAPEDAVRQCRAAMVALDLDFGAIDVGLTGEGVDGMMDSYVLEVNTCPGLDSGTLARYVAAVKERLA
jgi:hypothetical protein